MTQLIWVFLSLRITENQYLWLPKLLLLFIITSSKLGMGKNDGFYFVISSTLQNSKMVNNFIPNMKIGKT